jgi:hypothetical protein
VARGASPVTALHVLANSPVASLRALGFAGLAWITTFADEASAAELLDRSDAETGSAAGTDHAGPCDVLATVRAWAYATHHMVHGDDRDGLRHAEAGLSTPLDSGSRNLIHIDLSAVAAVCQLLLGQPELALQTVAWLDELDLPYYDGAQVAALVHLTVGELDTARALIERHARQAVTDRLSREAGDSVLLLAALARAEGDDALARRLLTGMGVGRQPATIRYGSHLADLLAVEDPRARWHGRSDPADPDGVLGAKLGLRTLRAELARRGWD